MPLNRPALSLGSGPRGVRDARRWVNGVCEDIGRQDVLECASLGVSELVTNALLHADPPIQVQVRGTADHPRIEVRDGSTRAPLIAGAVPSFDDLNPTQLPEDLDDLLMTFGRGLDMVARASEAWGADIDSEGKVLWFEPAAALAEAGGATGVLTDLTVASAEETTGAAVEIAEVTLLHVPVQAHLTFQRHYRELRRELRLLSMSHEEKYPVAKTLLELLGSLEGRLPRDLGTEQIDAAHDRGDQYVDLSVRLSTARVVRVGQISELLDLADDFCREERLLVLGRTPGQASFQRWMLGQYVAQTAGLPAQAWVDDLEVADSAH